MELINQIRAHRAVYRAKRDAGTYDALASVIKDDGAMDSLVSVAEDAQRGDDLLCEAVIKINALSISPDDYVFPQPMDGAEGGVSLRNYFAAEALSTIDSRSLYPKDVAKLAYKIADAMIERANS